ncbi:hypothetical protein [Bacillus cereus group sp. N21]|uniref:hypothetical protein n=1 Tax=Bacillus cereus group sp. N21 TaxID=2794591 RepID=UPI0018F7A03A|nr:hypothetical protein [Bacillus cereus group sp. N21]MBJ8030393.1 hypothetical protein [Bacillus cereus group sp. N21]
MYKKLTIGILSVGIIFIGNSEAFATNNYNASHPKNFTEKFSNFTLPSINNTMTNLERIYELSIPVGYPYYLPSKISASGNNLYKYKIVLKNPSEDWEINYSNGEVVCGVEGNIKIEVFDEYNILISTYIITAGGI